MATGRSLNRMNIIVMKGAKAVRKPAGAPFFLFWLRSELDLLLPKEVYFSCKSPKPVPL